MEAAGSSSPFFLLYPDARLLVFEHLKGRDLVACQRVCKEFYSTTLNPALKWTWYQAAADKWLSVTHAMRDPLTRVIGSLTIARFPDLPFNKRVDAYSPKLPLESEYRTLLKRIAFRWISDSICEKDPKLSAYLLLQAQTLLDSFTFSSADVAFCLTAIAAAKISNPEKCKQLLIRAESHAHNLDVDFFRGLVLAHIAKIYQQLNENDKATQLFDQAIFIASVRGVDERIVIEKEISYLQNGASPQSDWDDSLLQKASRNENLAIPYSQIRSLCSGVPPEHPICIDAEIEARFNDHMQAFTLFKESKISEALKAHQVALEQINALDEERTKNTLPPSSSQARKHIINRIFAHFFNNSLASLSIRADPRSGEEFVVIQENGTNAVRVQPLNMFLGLDEEQLEEAIQEFLHFQPDDN